MEFLDPQKERLVRLRLFIGYALVALAIGIATLVLLYSSYGYTVDREGDVARHGLVFVSSDPNGAQISLNGEDATQQTNTKLNLSSGEYRLKVSLDGYRDWQRPVSVEGGDVQRFDYVQLFPATLNPSSLAEFTGPVVLFTQSPDKRWIMIMEQARLGSFALYDLKSPLKPVRTDIAVPAELLTNADTSTWKLVEWSDDNVHALFERTYTAGATTAREYILVDRDKPELSLNLTRTLGLPQQEQLSLFDKKPTSFYAYNAESKVLRSFTATEALPIQLTNVRAFKTYSDDTVLYVTDTPVRGKPTPGKVSVVLLEGTQATTLRQLTDLPNGYLLDLAEYDGDWYAAAASIGETGVYVFKNPQTQKVTPGSVFPRPWRLLRVTNPSYIAFSAGTRFLLAQNGQQVVIYDAENVQTHSYMITKQLAAPLTHATWNDQFHLSYVSDGALVIQDYDNRNPQVLQPATAEYPPVYSGNGRVSYALTTNAAGATVLTMTPFIVQAN